MPDETNVSVTVEQSGEPVTPLVEPSPAALPAVVVQPLSPDPEVARLAAEAAQQQADDRAETRRLAAEARADATAATEAAALALSRVNYLEESLQPPPAAVTPVEVDTRRPVADPPPAAPAPVKVRGAFARMFLG